VEKCIPAPRGRTGAGAERVRVNCPDFLYAALDTVACAAFIEESRMNIAKANKLHRKSGFAKPIFTPLARFDVADAHWF
jgi:hypothetical protein